MFAGGSDLLRDALAAVGELEERARAGGGGAGGAGGGGAFRYERRTVRHHTADGADIEYDETRRAAGHGSTGVVSETTKRFHDSAKRQEALLVERSHGTLGGAPRGHAISRMRTRGDNGADAETTAERLFGGASDADQFDVEWRMAASAAGLHRPVGFGPPQRHPRSHHHLQSPVRGAAAGPSAAEQRALAAGAALHQRRHEDMVRQARQERTQTTRRRGQQQQQQQQQHLSLRQSGHTHSGRGGPPPAGARGCVTDSRGRSVAGGAHGLSSLELARRLAREELLR